MRSDPWFPTHHERDVYISLLQQSDPPAPEALLKAALIRRAVADVTRIFRIRDDKAALTVLLQKGSIGDDLWTRFQAAEKELEAEIVEVVTEANTFVEGWGQIIFQSASEMVQNEKYRDVFLGIPKAKVELGEVLPVNDVPADTNADRHVDPPVTLYAFLDRKLGKASKAPAGPQIEASPSVSTPTISVTSTPSKPVNGIAKKLTKSGSTTSSVNGSPVKSVTSLPNTDSAPLTPTKDNIELTTSGDTPSGKVRAFTDYMDVHMLTTLGFIERVSQEEEK